MARSTSSGTPARLRCGEQACRNAGRVARALLVGEHVQIGQYEAPRLGDGRIIRDERAHAHEHAREVGQPQAQPVRAHRSGGEDVHAAMRGRLLAGDGVLGVDEALSLVAPPREAHLPGQAPVRGRLADLIHVRRQVWEAAEADTADRPLELRVDLDLDLDPELAGDVFLDTHIPNPEEGNERRVEVREGEVDWKWKCCDAAHRRAGRQLSAEVDLGRHEVVVERVRRDLVQELVVLNRHIDDGRFFGTADQRCNDRQCRANGCAKWCERGAQHARFISPTQDTVNHWSASNRPAASNGARQCSWLLCLSARHASALQLLGLLKQAKTAVGLVDRGCRGAAGNAKRDRGRTDPAGND